MIPLEKIGDWSGEKNQDCQWMLCGKEPDDKMWIISKFYPKHACDVGECAHDHFNLDIDMIVNVLVDDIAQSPRFKIKDCITAVLKVYRKIISRRKTYLGRRRTHEIVYGNWDNSFKTLPRYVTALQHFNAGTVIEWKLKSKHGVTGNIFQFVFCHSNHALMVLLIVGQ
ncbi:uncharacterized protein LOC132060707 [Lycium ferocissimum]|uniref:uncharacterized protein LOC132060707 n=1 Tax=Lycium ferocissimum TaxID=112874 RepID=UPI0028152966|nr:uncharacterized protein LOC132060707 [Lycium ferocissimum]